MKIWVVSGQKAYQYEGEESWVAKAFTSQSAATEWALMAETHIREIADRYESACRHWSDYDDFDEDKRPVMPVNEVDGLALALSEWSSPSWRYGVEEIDLEVDS